MFNFKRKPSVELATIEQLRQALEERYPNYNNHELIYYKALQDFDVVMMTDDDQILVRIVNDCKPIKVKKNVAYFDKFNILSQINKAVRKQLAENSFYNYIDDYLPENADNVLVNYDDDDLHGIVQFVYDVDDKHVRCNLINGYVTSVSVIRKVNDNYVTTTIENANPKDSAGHIGDAFKNLLNDILTD